MPTITSVPIKDLKLAKFNPASRSKDVNELAKSLERVGLLYPVLVTDKMEVVDGHRRIAAAKKLGWSSLTVLVAKGSQPEMFHEVNSTVRQLSGNQTLQVYLVEPEALTPRMRQRVGECEETVGRTLVKRLADEGFSLGAWYTTKQIIKLADLDDDQFTIKTLHWIMKYRCGRLVQRAIGQGVAPSKVVAAIKNDKPLRITYVS